MPQDKQPCGSINSVSKEAARSIGAGECKCLQKREQPGGDIAACKHQDRWLRLHGVWENKSVAVIKSATHIML